MLISCNQRNRKKSDLEQAVSRILFLSACATKGNDHSSSPAVTNRIKQPTESSAGRLKRSPIWSCSGWVCLAPDVTPGLVSFTSPFHPYPASAGVCFLWHCPARHRDWGLPSILPAESGLSSDSETRASDHLPYSKHPLHLAVDFK